VTGQIAERYRRFAELEAGGRSPLYARLALGVAGDPEVLALLARVPPAKQQPNLLLASVRSLAGVRSSYPAFRAAVLDQPEAVTATLLTHRAQTNEVGRCASLLPVLAALPGPLALLEVGASAGLCLLPDRYADDYGGRLVGDPASPVRLHCELAGPVPVPATVPEVVWRRGIDLDPVDVHDPEQVRWLECCVWPDQPERLARLRAAVGVPTRPPSSKATCWSASARSRPGRHPRPPSSSATPPCSPISPSRSERFAALVGALPAVWISNEGPDRLPPLAAKLDPGAAPPTAHFLLARDEELLAVTDPHGAWLHWLGDDEPAARLRA
jgi:hypothetical protein